MARVPGGLDDFREESREGSMHHVILSSQPILSICPAWGSPALPSPGISSRNTPVPPTVASYPRQACNHPFLVLGRAPPGAADARNGDVTLQFRQRDLRTSRAVASPDEKGGAVEEPGALLPPPPDNPGARDEEVEESGKTPLYVRELYRRFRERIASQEREQVDEVSTMASTDAAHEGGATMAGGEGAQDSRNKGQRLDSRAFVDSVVGQLRVRVTKDL